MRTALYVSKDVGGFCGFWEGSFGRFVFCFLCFFFVWMGEGVFVGGREGGGGRGCFGDVFFFFLGGEERRGEVRGGFGGREGEEGEGRVGEVCFLGWRMGLFWGEEGRGGAEGFGGLGIFSGGGKGRGKVVFLVFSFFGRGEERRRVDLLFFGWFFECVCVCLCVFCVALVGLFFGCVFFLVRFFFG